MSDTPCEEALQSLYTFLDGALTELAAEEPRLAELVELRFFAGMAVADIAVLHGVSERTLNRDWRRARAQLHATLFPDA